MKLFTANQIRNIDKFTIENEPVASIDLMDRAANALFLKLLEIYHGPQKFFIVCGKGNNGGDGLAMGRILLKAGFETKVFTSEEEGLSPDCKTNFNRLIQNFPETVFPLSSLKKQLTEDPPTIIIDAIFGTGLSKAVEGIWGEVINLLNSYHCPVVSVDLPSGLPSEPWTFDLENLKGNVIKATHTITIEQPKLSFLFPETGSFAGQVHMVEIGLHPKVKEQTETPYYYTTWDDTQKWLPKRDKFSFKNNFGHVLLIAGSTGKAGAAILSAKSAMKVGAGLVTSALPDSCISAMQTNFPEGMTLAGLGADFIERLPGDLSRFSVLAAGPGLNINKQTADCLLPIIEKWNGPLVLDADALNMIADQEDFNWPKNTVITPHPGEFDRLTKKHHSTVFRFQTLKNFAKEKMIIVVLKGAYTAIADPEGNVYFNSAGNQGMAKAGCGDVLTGIIGGLLAQGLNEVEACRLGVYIHGFTGDQVVKTKSPYSLMASDIIDQIPAFFLQSEKNTET
jgi:NAD(P)H-hydrate epimerase